MWLTPNTEDVSIASEGWLRNPLVEEDDDEDEAS
jgi:hypothetical protein